jgi:imidazolonepropionase-like amidohydrolase
MNVPKSFVAALIVFATGFTVTMNREGLGPPACAAAETETLVVSGAKIYPSPDTAPITNGVVVMRSGKIAAVGNRGGVSLARTARIVDCAGMVVTAGFQNSHVHFTEAKWNNAGTVPAARLTAQLTAMFNLYGFTAVVDTGSIVNNTRKLRARIESGEVSGPRIVATQASLFPPDGVPIYLRDLLSSWTPDQPATPEAAISIVRRDGEGSQDILKLFTGSLVTYENIKPMPVEIAKAAVAEAHRQGRLAFAHPSNIEGVQIALAAGVDVLAHTTSAPGTWSQSLVAEVVKHHMGLVPTLKLWKYVTQGAPDPSVGEQMLQNGIAQLREVSQAGGEILFGTDVGFMGDYDPTDEYVFMARAGLTPMQILASLTTAPAAKFKEDGHRGRIAVGMAADLVVLGGDPAQDVRNFTDVRYTIRRGKLIYPGPAK